MHYTNEIQSMCPIQRGDLHASSPIPVEGRMINPKDVIAISGLSTVLAHVLLSRAQQN